MNKLCDNDEVIELLNLAVESVYETGQEEGIWYGFNNESEIRFKELTNKYIDLGIINSIDKL